MTRDHIISRAHEWRTHPAVTRDAQSWPAKNMVRCILCGAVAVIGEWDIPRCRPRIEQTNSGFKDETDTPTWVQPRIDLGVPSDRPKQE